MNITIFNACVAPELIDEYYKMIGANAPVPNVLTSYLYANGSISRLLQMKKEGKIGQLFLDSGAYTYKRGEIFKDNYEAEKYLDALIGYYGLFGDMFDTYFSLDNFNDSENNLSNFLRINNALTNNKKKVVPVLHEDGGRFIEEFGFYINMGCTHVAIGSNVKKISNKQWDEFQNLRDKNGIKIHLFGVIYEKEIEKLKMIRPDSCDSGKIFQAAKFGFLLYLKKNPENQTQVLDRIYIGERHETPAKTESFHAYFAKEENKGFKDYLDSIGVTHGSLLDSSTQVFVINLHQLCLYEKYLNEVVFAPAEKK